MPLLAYGVSFRTAAIDIRERIAFPRHELAEALSGLQREVDGLSEAAILSTCNRTEIYCALADRNHDPLADWVAGHRAIGAGELAGTAYALWDREAARHLMRVASGLDSQVLGEPQIMGQVKAAYDLARDTATLGPELNLLSHSALTVAKRVRTETDIGKNPVSVAYVAVTMAQQVFSDLGATRALLVGAGETVELVSRHLRKAGVCEIAIANRTPAHAHQLAASVGAVAMGLEDIASRLGEYDVVISSTDAAEHIITAAMVEEAMHGRSRPMFLVDIAVPRDIEPAAGLIDGVFLHSVDDLVLIVEENAAARRHAGTQAETLIDAGVIGYDRARRLRGNQDLLQQFRGRADGIREETLARARQRLDSGQESAEVIERLAYELTNKLIHAPTVAIRDASADERVEFLESLRSLYGLE